MILGCHVNFGEKQLLGSLEQALSYGANALMFYTGAPQNTIRKPIHEEYLDSFYEMLRNENFDIGNIICHAPYIINLANKSDLSKYEFSIDFLTKEIARCQKMGICKIVLHPGSAVGISHEEGIQNIIEALNRVVSQSSGVKILLETMAGKGSECGISLEEIKMILDGVIQKDSFGVCIDTCHLNDAGYCMQEIDAFLEEFEQKIGIHLIGCVHLNDSKNLRGMKKDRHANIGFGTLGFDTLLKVAFHPKLKDVPKILETPWIGESDDDKNHLYPPYKFEIEMLKKQVFDEELLQKIRSFYK